MTDTPKLPTRPDESAMALIEKSTRRQHFTDVRHVTVRWEPYKPDGRRQMRAAGRWQEQGGSGDYWSWQNCDRPAFAHDPDLTEARIAADVAAERERCAAIADEWGRIRGGDVAEHIAAAIRAGDGV